MFNQRKTETPKVLWATQSPWGIKFQTTTTRFCVVESAQFFPSKVDLISAKIQVSLSNEVLTDLAIL